MLQAHLFLIKIIPAILAKSYNEFQTMVRAIEPYTDLVHLDIADGQFVPNKTINGFDELSKIDTKLNFEIHLMINRPENVIGRWLKVSKAIRFLIHRESVMELNDLINKIREGGRKIGLVLNPQTSYSAIEPYLDKIDLVQFMTVDSGFQGSPFLPEVLEKIKIFHKRHPDKIIQVDGGITPETIKLIKEAGSSRVAVGSYIFQSQNIEQALKELSV